MTMGEPGIVAVAVQVTDAPLCLAQALQGVQSSWKGGAQPSAHIHWADRQLRR